MEKLRVDNSKCIGCGLCISLNENYFEFNDEGLVNPKEETVNPNDKTDLLDAVENCPANAITIEDEKEAQLK